MRDHGRFLKTRGTDIVLGGQEVLLKGVNLGGWLMMEGYILHAPNVAVKAFKKDFAGKLGESALKEFERRFNSNFIMRTDLKRISAMGFNCIRVPLHYRIVEKAAFEKDDGDLECLDQLVRWAKHYRLWVVLDLHAAPGSQNHDWHSDSLGPARLWTDAGCRSKTVKIWEFLAGRYRNETTVAGYDLLNEAVTDNVRLLNDLYRDLVLAIRRVDKNHILFIEGNKWARDLDCLDDFGDDNAALSIHFYDPIEFTFNFVPHLSYPPRGNGRGYDKKVMRKVVRDYLKTARRRSMPVFVGEFGVNYRQGLYGEDKWLKDVLDCFNEAGFHWTYWTYKAVKNSIFPDGIYSYYPNPEWVRRHGPDYGWENFAAAWPRHKKEMVRSWRTENFRENPEITKVPKNAAR